MSKVQSPAGIEIPALALEAAANKAEATANLIVLFITNLLIVYCYCYN